MEHVYLPVKQGESFVGTVYDAYGDEFCISHGMTQEAAARAAFITRAVNDHDALVALRDRLVEYAVDHPFPIQLVAPDMDDLAIAIHSLDNLVVQRDALVEACEAHLAWEEHANRCLMCGIMGRQCETAHKLERKADNLVRAALALVEATDA